MPGLGRRRASHPRDTPSKPFLQTQVKAVCRAPFGSERPTALGSAQRGTSLQPPKLRRRLLWGLHRGGHVGQCSSRKKQLRPAIMCNSELARPGSLVSTFGQQDLLYLTSAGHSGWFTDASLILRSCLHLQFCLLSLTASGPYLDPKDEILLCHHKLQGEGLVMGKVI